MMVPLTLGALAFLGGCSGSQITTSKVGVEAEVRHRAKKAALSPNVAVPLLCTNERTLLTDGLSLDDAMRLALVRSCRAPC